MLMSEHFFNLKGFELIVISRFLCFLRNFFWESVMNVLEFENYFDDF